MPVIRKKIKTDFTTVHNYFIKDKDLPLCCKGLLLLLISLPDNWDFSITGLQAIVCEGRDKVKTTLKKLEKAGYLRRERITNEKGVILDWEYLFSDEPIYKDDTHDEEDNDDESTDKSSSDTLGTVTDSKSTHVEEPHTEDLHTEDPHMEEPHTEEPHTDNPHVGNKPVYKVKSDKVLKNQVKKDKLCGSAAQYANATGNTNGESMVNSEIKTDASIILIVNYLNEKAHTHYKSDSKDTCKYISEKLKEGFDIEDFKTVIDKKCSEWLNTEWSKYLRPKTLFGDNFESYLNANIKLTTSNKSDVYDSKMLEERTILDWVK